MYKCDKCGKEFKRYYKSYLKHIETCDYDPNYVKKHICKICNKEFKNGSALGGHIGVAHSENSMNKNKKYECSICNEILFCNKGAFENHIKNHDVEWKEKKASKISESWNELMNDEERSQKLSEFRSDYMKENNPMFEPKNVEKMTNSINKRIENMSEEEYSKLVLNFINAPKKGNAVDHAGKYTPTKIEQMIMDFNIEGLIYNGNKEDSQTIRFKNVNYKHSLTPDFIFKDTNKFIEAFGVYWHPKEDEEMYTNACKENGYEVLVIWEDKLHENPNKEKQRILNFLKDDI